MLFIRQVLCIKIVIGDVIIGRYRFVWLYEKNGDFKNKPVLKLHRNDLKDADNLYKLKVKLIK